MAEVTDGQNQEISRINHNVNNKNMNNILEIFF